MGLKQTTLWRFDPKKGYMTTAERSAFKELLKAGAISFFRIGQCEQCGADIPKSKKFCSIDCADQQEDKDGNKE
jgi:hypothetical protein